jgi:hypothetical protein
MAESHVTDRFCRHWKRHSKNQWWKTPFQRPSNIRHWSFSNGGPNGGCHWFFLSAFPGQWRVPPLQQGEIEVTRAQAKLAVSEIAARANGSAIKVHLNGGSIVVGTVAYDDTTGLLVVDHGRAYVRAEQAAAIEIIEL